MHRRVRHGAIAAGVAATAAIALTASTALAQNPPDDETEADAFALVLNDQQGHVFVLNVASSEAGGNEATTHNGNLVVIGQGADAGADLDSEALDEILHVSDGHSVLWVIPGTPAVVPVTGGDASNSIDSIVNDATGMAVIVSGSATVNQTTGVTLDQAFDGNDGADALADTVGATTDDASANAHALVINHQRAAVGVVNIGQAAAGGNTASTSNGNAVIIGQHANASAEAEIIGNADDDDPAGTSSGAVTGGSATNSVGSVSNTATGTSSITSGDATTSNSTTVSVSQSNTGNGGSVSTSTATGSP